MPYVGPIPPCDRIALIGPRGCGKSTVGRRLARALEWEFLDTDSLVEAAAGKSIAAIFAADGEPAFRELESQALQQALASRRAVISVGGGAVLSRANRDRLRRLAYCIWLTATADELQQRVTADPASPTSRPPLTPVPPPEEMRQVLAQRRPLYEALAHQVVDTSGRTPDEVAQLILAALRTGPAATEG
jgi:shikimate kinase